MTAICSYPPSHHNPNCDRLGIGLAGAHAQAGFSAPECERYMKIFGQDEDRYRLMADSTPVMTWVTDPDGNVIIVNRAYCDFFGVTEEQVVGPGGWLPLVHPDDAEKYVACFYRAVQQRKNFHCEARVKHASHEWRWVESFAAPRFSSDGTYLGHVGSSPDITKRREMECKLHEALHEKEILIKELYHRTKNNLALVCSLLDLQATATPEPYLQSIISELTSRIRSIALIHEMLYRSTSLTTVAMNSYLDALVHNIIASLKPPATVNLDLKIEDTELDLEHAIPYGLIVNELITNSLKHAFSKRTGNITLRFHSLDQKNFELRYADDGMGLPPGFNLETSSSLGMRLVRNLVRQLNASISLPPVTTGVEFRIVIPKA